MEIGQPLWEQLLTLPIFDLLCSFPICSCSSQNDRPSCELAYSPFSILHSHSLFPFSISIPILHSYLPPFLFILYSYSPFLLQALWEWGEESKDQWHTFERETNIQIEDMYDSGSQWVELTLCLPSPMPFLLDLHDMKLVNFRTAVRYNLRRIDNSENVQQGKRKKFIKLLTSTLPLYEITFASLNNCLISYL